MKNDSPHSLWRRKLYEVIFEADTAAGKFFDIILLWAILLSVIAVMLNSVVDIEQNYGSILKIIEWFFTILFTIEYIFRIICVPRKWRYIRSFFGIVDFVAIIPTYIGIFVGGIHILIVVRILRLLRIFRVFKLARYLKEGKVMLRALRASRPKIIVFLVTVLTVVTIIGAIMYLVEGDANGFTSIPRSIYWAIVTMTTVGYGDISPKTPLGQFLATIVMILGYAIIAVPTGMISFDVLKASQKISERICPQCGVTGHDADAKYCKYCGANLPLDR